MRFRAIACRIMVFWYLGICRLLQSRIYHQNPYLDHEEQFQKLQVYLKCRYKRIQRVSKNGLCILESFRVAYQALGYKVEIDEMKRSLLEEISSNRPLYEAASVSSVSVVSGMKSFFENPLKHYADDTIDLVTSIV